MIDKLIGLVTLDQGVFNVGFVRRFFIIALSGIMWTTICVCALFSCIASILCLAYFLMIRYGVDVLSAEITVSATAGVIASSVVGVAFYKIKKIKKFESFSRIEGSTSFISVIRNIAIAFMEGLLEKPN